MVLARLKYSAILAAAILAATGCAHDTRYSMASGGGGGGAAPDGGGDTQPAPTPAPEPAPEQPGGLQASTTTVGRSIGNVILSSGNTVKALGGQTETGGLLVKVGDKLVNIGATMGQDGLSGLPVVGKVTDKVIPELDRATAPAAKITLLNANTLGSGAAGSVQAIGASLGTTTPVQGSAASVNAFSGTFFDPGAAVAVDVAKGKVGSASVLPKSIGQPLQADSLASVAAGGKTLIPGGSKAVVNVNVLPDGARDGFDGLRDNLKDVADLNAILSPASAGQLGPVTGLVQSVTGRVTETAAGVQNGVSLGAGGSASGGIGLTAPLAPLAPLVAPLTSLVTPVTSLLPKP